MPAPDLVTAAVYKAIAGRIVSLIHEDTPALRRMAVFDVLVNNADRKGDHILTLAGGHRYGVDHGFTFRTQATDRAVGLDRR